MSKSIKVINLSEEDISAIKESYSKIENPSKTVDEVISSLGNKTYQMLQIIPQLEVLKGIEDMCDFSDILKKAKNAKSSFILDNDDYNLLLKAYDEGSKNLKGKVQFSNEQFETYVEVFKEIKNAEKAELK